MNRQSSLDVVGVDAPVPPGSSLFRLYQQDSHKSTVPITAVIRARIVFHTREQLLSENSSIAAT
jgi:hypothetical protein